MTKRCTKCGEELPLDMFNTDTQKPLDRYSSCKKCCSGYHKKNRARPEVRQRKRDRWDAKKAARDADAMAADGREWAPCPSYESAYQVSRCGLVRRIRSAGNSRPGSALKFRLRRWGYLTVTLQHQGRVSDRSVHRLVCEAFHGPPPSTRHQSNHINGNKLDNHADNLEWVTPAANMQHAVRMGLIKSGTKDPRSALTRDQVVRIRELGWAGLLHPVKHGALIGVSSRIVRNAVRGRSCQDVTEPPPVPMSRSIKYGLNLAATAAELATRGPQE